MNDNVAPVGINILGKEYRIACTVEERKDLVVSAQYLDQKMREIRDSGRIIGADKIAIMAALNIAHELTQVQSQNQNLSEGLSERLENLGKKIDTVLSPTDPS